MTEIGYQTDSPLPTWGSLLAETHETNPELMWPQSIDVFDRMRREDPQVKSVLRAVTLPILRTPWVIDGTGCREEVVSLIATDLGLQVKGQPPRSPRRSKGRFSWKEFLRLALLELAYGHSFFEQVYDQTSGQTRLAKLAWRPPRTISDIKVARDGGLIGIKQHGVKELIGVDRLVAFVNEREGANWIGESLLRSAYKMWLLKDRVLRIQALTAERNGLGLPTYTSAPPPDGASYEDIVKWLDDELARGLEIAKDARAGEAAGAALPHGAKMQFLGVEGRLPDTDKPIRYYDEQIARAVLAHFLNLGTETGSWALGSTFANFFTDSLNAVAQHIADVVQQHVIEDLVDHNWGQSEPAPQLVPAEIGEQQPVTAEAIKSLVDAGIITPDEATESHVRTLWGLPVRVEGAGRNNMAEARALAEILQKIYLAVGPVIDQGEARAIVRHAGGDLADTIPAKPEEAAA